MTIYFCNMRAGIYEAASTVRIISIRLTPDSEKARRLEPYRTPTLNYISPPQLQRDHLRPAMHSARARLQLERNIGGRWTLSTRDPEERTLEHSSNGNDRTRIDISPAATCSVLLVPLDKLRTTESRVLGTEIIKLSWKNWSSRTHHYIAQTWRLSLRRGAIPLNLLIYCC